MSSTQSEFVTFLLQRLKFKRFLAGPRNKELPEKIIALLQKRYRIEQFSAPFPGTDSHSWLLMQPLSGKNACDIMYLHGGGFINGVDPLHLAFLAQLMDKMPCRIIIPDYPLAPDYTVDQCFAMLSVLYSDFTGDRNPDHPLYIMGDSAGGNLVLGMARLALDRNMPLPHGLVLLSPWLELSMSNPAIDAVETEDPLLFRGNLASQGIKWAGERDLDDPLVSPLYMDLTGLPPILLLTGDRDMLNPDARRFLVRAWEQEHDIRYSEYPEMMHVWMLFTFFPESRQAIDEILGFIGNLQKHP